MPNRRSFIIHVGLAGTALITPLAFAQLPMVAENDPLASSLGYKGDGTKTDKAKFPKYAADQRCDNCTLYQGKAADAGGGCALFPAKQVAAKGWCSAWVKKA